MNSLERILAAVNGEPVDRTPVVPVMLMQGAKELGLTLPEYFERPNRLVEGQLRLLDRFGHDGVFAFPHIVQDVLPWGSSLTFHDDGPPTVGKMVIRRFEDIDDLQAPDPTAHPYLRHTLDAASALAREVGGEKLVVGAIIGPFSLPSMLMGTKKFLELLEDAEPRERYYDWLMQAMIEFAARWAAAQMEAGCHLVVFAEGIASATIIDEDTFVRYAKPVIEEFVARVGRYGGKGLLALEFVGHGFPFMHHVRDLNVAAFLIGESDPVVETRKIVGPKKAIMGNVNNLKLLRWGPERVQFEARRLVARAGPGFILSNQGPEIPWEVPYPVIEALVRAATSQTATG